VETLRTGEDADVDTGKVGVEDGKAPLEGEGGPSTTIVNVGGGRRISSYHQLVGMSSILARLNWAKIAVVKAVATCTYGLT
jgi:hypothetical protein